MTIAGLRRYDDWRHVATGCTALVFLMISFSFQQQIVNCRPQTRFLLATIFTCFLTRVDDVVFCAADVDDVRAFIAGGYQRLGNKAGDLSPQMTVNSPHSLVFWFTAK